MGAQRVHAVDGVSFPVEKGDSVGIVGESGSGKSTLGLALLRLLGEPTAEVRGEALLEGMDLLTLAEKDLQELRWRRMAAVFQKSMNALSPVHKIGKQMADVYRVHHPEASREQAKQRALETLRQVNLAERVYTSYPHELSGGMMQRVSIALSLLNHPDLIIFDEATTALDVVTQGQILKEIQYLERELGLTRLMITHDISVVAASCSHVAVMYAGRLMEYGPTAKVLRSPRHPYTQGLLRAYPSLRGEKTGMQGIPGALPDLKEEIPGCVFAPRCPWATEDCRQRRPEEVTIEAGWRASCPRAVEGREPDA
ncbi:MAG: ABC transporter ATP-binding protein [Clostridia bacterium]|nr:ABC transporter ATP-binding protein [Clostridia bacterium]